MSCNCGSGVISPLGCGQPNCSCSQNFSPAGSCAGRPVSCQCQPVSPCTPSPYYNAADGIQENHCQQIIQQFYTTGIKSSTVWNVPACGGTAIIIFPGLQSIAIGSYLWSPIYGHFRVVAFDFMSGQVTVINDCLESAAAPGAQVPACTIFSVVDTPGVPIQNTVDAISARVTAIEAWQADPCSWDIYDRFTCHTDKEDSGGQNVNVVLTNEGDSSETTVIDMRLYNDSCKKSKMMVICESGNRGKFNALDTNFADMTSEFLFSINYGAVGTTVVPTPSTSRATHEHKVFGRNSANIYHSNRYVEPILIDLDPGIEANIGIKTKCTLVYRTGGVTFTFFEQYADINAFLIEM